MMRHRLQLLVALFSCARLLSAQSSFVSVTTYEVAVPIGETRDFLTSTSWLGFSWEGRWALASRAYAGVQVGLNDFSQRTDGTMNFPSGAATGPQFRYLLSTPLLVTGYVYPIDTYHVRWYVGGAAGYSYILQLFELGVRQITHGAWHAVLAPEAGVEVRAFGEGVIGLVSVRYSAPASAGDYLGGGSRSFRHLTVRMGFGEEW